MQRSWGRTEAGVLENKEEAPSGWSRVMEGGERGKGEDLGVYPEGGGSPRGL